MSPRFGLIALVALFSACGASSPPHSEPSRAGVEPVVPVYEEPRHRPVFQNRFVRVLDVVIPAGDTTGYHTHAAPIAGAVIEDARNWSQIQGASPGEVRPVRAAGDVIENWDAVLPYTHRVGNVDGVPIHYVVGEWLASPGIEAPPLPETSSRHLVREGTFARVYRILLAPGESTESHTHAAPGLTIQVTAGPTEDAGSVAATSGGEGAGAWRWRGTGCVHVLSNRGERPALVMEIDWR